MQRIVQRAQVGIHLLRKIARQKAQLFAGFHGGAGEDDAFDFLVLHRNHRHGDSKIRFARTGGPHGEGTGVLLNRVHVGFLAQRFAFYLPSAAGDRDHIAHDFADAIRVALRRQPDCIADARAIYRFAAADDFAHFFQRQLCQCHLLRFAGQQNFRTVRLNFYVQLLAEHGKVFLAEAEQADKFLSGFDRKMLCGNHLFIAFQAA